MQLYADVYWSPMSIGERLDQAMKAAGVRSQSELSRRSGVPQPTINRILKGPGAPEASTALKIAKSLGINFVWLMQGDGPMWASDLTNESLTPVELSLIEVYRQCAEPDRAFIVSVVEAIRTRLGTGR